MFFLMMVAGTEVRDGSDGTDSKMTSSLISNVGVEDVEDVEDVILLPITYRAKKDSEELKKIF